MDLSASLRTAPLQPRARAFADYWLTLAKMDLIPHRRDFDPAALTAVLDTFMIFEITDPDCFKIRLAGTTVTENYGREVTGANYLDLRSPEERPITRAAMTLIVTHPCAQRVRQELLTAEGILRRSESLGLPMRDENGDARLMYYQVDNAEITDYRTREERYVLSKKTVTRQFLDIGNGTPDFAHVGDVD